MRGLMIVTIFAVVSINAWGIVGLAKSPRYQFQVVAPFDSTIKYDLNKLGDDGWSIASCRRASGDLGPSYECIMQRAY